MSVRVVQHDGTAQVHDNAAEFILDQGSLLIQDAKGRSVALYATGRWISAVVEDAKKSN